MESEGTKKPRRRWLQFGLRSLLMAMTTFGVWLGVHMQRVRRQKEGVQAIREFGGCVHYDFQAAPKPIGWQYDSRIEPPLPKWLLSRLGEDFFYNVVEVNLVYDSTLGSAKANPNVTDAALTNLDSFPKLRGLYLKETQATDDSLRLVGKLKGLIDLYMWDAATITDEGIAHLSGLSNLKSIHVSNSQIGDESLRVLGGLPVMQRMVLQGNHFTDHGLAHLQGCDSLHELWIGMGPTITDAGMTSLRHLTNLEILDLSDTRVTGYGLAQLADLTKLKTLYLSGTNADPSALSKALPKCSIVH